MIAFGVAAVKRFQWITVVFAAILLVSSYKLLVESEEEDHDLSQNALVRWGATAHALALSNRLFYYSYYYLLPHAVRVQIVVLDRARNLWHDPEVRVFFFVP